MANHHHQPSTSPIKEHEQEGQDPDLLYEPSPGWCGSCFGSKWWQVSPESSSDHHNHQSWWGHVTEKLKKAREVSEVAAGPKWKNFVRKVGGYFTGKKPRRSRMRGNFQYDAESYALNFDGGNNNGEDDDDEQGFLLSNTYSSRFVASSLVNKEHNHGGL